MFLRIELAGNEFVVVFLDVSCSGLFEQREAVVHFDTERVEHGDHL